MSSVQGVLAQAAVRSVFQPIVDLDSGAIVAYEALARGPEGPLSSPAALFAAARVDGVLAELDEACRTAAFRGAVGNRMLAPLTVFVNVEPEVLDTAPVDDLLAIAQGAPGELRVVLEITERALTSRPAELLRTVARVRQLGWGIALDDVGADVSSLAFMPLLRPDVIKLDLSLVQSRPDRSVAQIMHAVNAHSERTGALILAEGIETQRHVDVALSLGATLGQGWLFGRPGPGPVPGHPVAELHLASAPGLGGLDGSPFACLRPGTTLRRAPKRLLVEFSRQLEREALRVGETSIIASTFQVAEHFTPTTAEHYRELVDHTAFACVLAGGMAPEPVPGLRGADLVAGDPVRDEWDVVVLGPHFAAALLARDIGDDAPDLDRRFDYALTYDRGTVVHALETLVSRVTGPGVPPLPARP